MPNLPRFPGSSRMARDLQRLRDGIPDDMRGAGGVAVAKSGTAVTIGPGRMPGTGHVVAMQRFRVVSEAADHLVCRPINPVGLDDAGATYGAEDLGPVDVFVAKPYLLRRTVFDGFSVIYPDPQTISYTYAQHWEREADDGTDTETQVMTPRYFVDEQIVAVRGIQGTTGVWETSGPSLVEWEDTNNAGRMWAKQ